MPDSSPRLQLALLIALVGLGAVRTVRRAAPEPTRWVDSAEGVCAAFDGRELRATLCADPHGAAWFAPDDVRHALGLPPCWYSAPATRLAAIPGVGAVAAARVCAFRAAGGERDADRIAQLEDVSPRQALAVLEGTTDACSRVSGSRRDAGSDEPSGSSRP